MHDVNHALAVIRDRIGLKQLAFNSAGAAELVIEGKFSVYINKVSDAELELSVWLEDFAGKLNGAVMRALLNANSLGTGSGAGRLAIEPGSDAVLYCSRINVVDIEARSFETRFEEFVRYAAFWALNGVNQTLAAAEEQEKPAEMAIDHFIRI